MLFAMGFICHVRHRRTVGRHARARSRSTSTSRDTYFIVAHIHYVFVGGSVFTIFAGVHYWFPKMTGKMYNERLGQISFWVIFIGFNATFMPMHWLGLQGMPRRVVDLRLALRGPEPVHRRSPRCVMTIGILIFFYNMIRSWKNGPGRPVEPLARAHAGVARLVAALALQLRGDPPGRGRPVPVRRPRRAPRRGLRARGDRRRAHRDREAHDPRHRQRDRGRRRPGRRDPATAPT